MGVFDSKYDAAVAFRAAKQYLSKERKTATKETAAKTFQVARTVAYDATKRTGMMGHSYYDDDDDDSS